MRRLSLKSVVQRTTRISAITHEYDKMPSLSASFALKGEGQNLHFSDISQGFFARFTRFISVDLCNRQLWVEAVYKSRCVIGDGSPAGGLRLSDFDGLAEKPQARMASIRGWAPRMAITRFRL